MLHSVDLELPGWICVPAMDLSSLDVDLTPRRSSDVDLRSQEVLGRGFEVPEALRTWI